MKRYLPFVVIFFVLSVSDVAFAGPWTFPRGWIWFKSVFYYQTAHSRFCTEQDALSLAFRDAGCRSAGHSAPFDPFVGGKSRAAIFFTEVVYGATDWLNLGIQVPFYHLRFTNLSDPDRPVSAGLGDIRAFAKIRLLEDPFVASIKIGAKSPTGNFDVDAEVVNISEGQWDYEFFGEIGRSLWPVPGYVSLGAGYRIRKDNENFDYTMGNEFNLFFETGINVTTQVLLKGSMEWLRGERPKIKTTGDKLLWRRELMTISPSIIYSPFENLRIETSIRFPVRGRDFPDSAQFVLGGSYQFSLYD